MSNLEKHDCDDLIMLFNQCFATKLNTRLIKGKNEPVYLPADNKQSWNSIYFAHGFFSSALHECAHWLIAGEARRKLIDYGYWYEPDGRNVKQQQLFQQVEIKPQALEWILSVACGYRFRLSVDNLNGENIGTGEFETAVYQQVLRYCEQGLNQRATVLRQALCLFYGTSLALNPQHFHQEDIMSDWL